MWSERREKEMEKHLGEPHALFYDPAFSSYCLLCEHTYTSEDRKKEAELWSSNIITYTHHSSLARNNF